MNRVTQFRTQATQRTLLFAPDVVDGWGLQELGGPNPRIAQHSMGEVRIVVVIHDGEALAVPYEGALRYPLPLKSLTGGWSTADSVWGE